jgi:hypothetical protein
MIEQNSEDDSKEQTAIDLFSISLSREILLAGKTNIRNALIMLTR